MLIDLREAVTQLFDFEPEKIDHHDVTRHRREVAAIAIGADMLLKAGAAAEAEVLSLLWCDDEARAVKFHAGRAKPYSREQRLRRCDIYTNSEIGIDTSRHAPERKLRLVRIEPLLRRHLQQRAIMRASDCDRHGDANGGGLFGGFGPGMIGNGEEQRDG